MYHQENFNFFVARVNDLWTQNIDHCQQRYPSFDAFYAEMFDAFQDAERQYHQMRMHANTPSDAYSLFK